MPTFMPAAAQRYLARFNHCLARYFEQQQQRLSALSPQLQILHDAMSYSSLDGGKRLRAMLVYLSAETCNPALLDSDAANQRPDPDDFHAVDNAAIALELIHCYSLVHDDLPAMDDDDLRRGKPTNHKVYGEANAILAGDALQAAAFELLSIDNNTLAAESRLQLVQTLASAAGAAGMVGGQVIDLALTDRPGSEQQLRRMHQLKTGALISAATRMGAICAGAGPAARASLQVYGEAIGLAFQVRDDLLDLVGDPALLGKQTGMDEAANKTTFPALLGLEAAENEAISLKNKAINALAEFGDSATALAQLAAYVVDRSS